ncbi:MAG: SDR family oxidoreductase [Gemmatimonadota bacterium]|nr:SDR family oxidoreductase [Gemmatimonadota bacterium]
MSGVVAVTGAAGAIGRATVRRFLDGGWTVVGMDRDRSVEESIGPGYRGYEIDLEDESGLEAVIEDARSAGPLRHAVGIAGGALPDEPGTQDDPVRVSPELFRRSIEANLTTQFVFVRSVLPWLRADPDADRSILLTSSFNALTGCGMPAYSAAKAGLIGMMNALTAPLGSEGIRLNVVAPGTIRTPRTERIWAADRGHFERLEAGTALGRLGEPEDVAAAFWALATVTTHVTGEVFLVDGGQTVKRADARQAPDDDDASGAGPSG